MTRYQEYAPPNPPSRLGELKSTIHEIEGTGSKTVGVWVEKDGKPWFDGHVKINPLTGIASGKRFNSTAESTALIEEWGTVSYGFHDAGEARRSQVYAYVTPNLSNWLGDLIKGNSEWLNTPFTKLALPGSHDSGMYGDLHAGLVALIEEGRL